jgi:peptidoglycan/LPS O-acetylase OafA/YrhL
MRRFCRVLPIYYLCIALAAVAYYFFNLPVGSRRDWIYEQTIPWHSYTFFTQNFWMAKLNTVGAPILAVTWAFAVEVQFYFVVPLLIRFVKRSVLPYVFMAGIAIAPLARLFVVYRFRANWWATYVLLPCRMDSLFLGLLCAYCVREPAIWDWTVKRRNKLWLVFLVLLGGMPLLNSDGIPFTLLWITVGYGWMSILFATTMLLILTDSKSLLSRIMRWGWLTELGTISYGVYLFHVGIYAFCLWRLTGHGWPPQSLQECRATVLAFSITIFAAMLSWHYFEKPIVRWGHKWRY